MIPETNELKMKVVGKSAAVVNRVVDILMGGGCGVWGSDAGT